MAKQSQPRAKAPAEAPETTQAPAETQAEAPAPAEPRRSLPVAPKATSGDSVPVTARIRDIVQAALYRREPDAIPAAIEQIEAVKTIKSAPAVAQYKAEVLDYLRGKAAA